MSSLNDKLDYSLDTKELIKQAIVDKGVEVEDGTTLRQYASKIAEIQGGGGTVIEGGVIPMYTSDSTFEQVFEYQTGYGCDYTIEEDGYYAFSLLEPTPNKKVGLTVGGAIIISRGNDTIQTNISVGPIYIKAGTSVNIQGQWCYIYKQNVDMKVIPGGGGQGGSAPWIKVYEGNIDEGSTGTFSAPIPSTAIEILVAAYVGREQSHVFPIDSEWTTKDVAFSVYDGNNWRKCAYCTVTRNNITQNGAGGYAGFSKATYYAVYYREVGGGGSGSSSEDIEITLEEYDALPDTKYTDGKHYLITDYVESGSGGGGGFSSMDVTNVLLARTEVSDGYSYTATEDCFCDIEFRNGNYAGCQVFVNGVIVAQPYSYGVGSNPFFSIPFIFPLAKGDVLTFDANDHWAPTILTIYGSKSSGGGSDSSSLPDYSTTETKTGRKWIDGKDVYQITFTGTANFGLKSYVTVGTDPGISTLISKSFVAGGFMIPPCYVKFDSGNVQAYMTEDALGTCSYACTIEYTKS